MTALATPLSRMVAAVRAELERCRATRTLAGAIAVRLALAREGSEVVLSVEDEGIGISQ